MEFIPCHTIIYGTNLRIFFRSRIFFPRLGEGHLHTHFKTQRLGVVCMKSADLRVPHLKLYKD